MIRELTCIECPKGCRLTIEDGAPGQGLKISGNKCAKGEMYGRAEVSDPVRILTASILAQGLQLKMIPVRTDRPIPKDRLFDVMFVVKKARVSKPVKCGEVIVVDLLGLGVNLVATRSVGTRALS